MPRADKALRTALQRRAALILSRGCSQSTLSRWSMKKKQEDGNDGRAAEKKKKAPAGGRARKRHTRSRHRAKPANGEALTKQQINQLLAWERRGQVSTTTGRCAGHSPFARFASRSHRLGL